MSGFDNDTKENDDNLSEEEDNVESGVQLGFLEKNHNALFHDQEWNNWDGGKVGGFPVWYS